MQQQKILEVEDGFLDKVSAAVFRIQRRGKIKGAKQPKREQPQSLGTPESTTVGHSTHLVGLQQKIRQKDSLLEEKQRNYERLKLEFKAKERLCTQYKADYDKLLQSTDGSEKRILPNMLVQSTPRSTEVWQHHMSQKEEEIEALKIEIDIIKHEMGEELMETKRKYTALKSRNKDLLIKLVKEEKERKLLEAETGNRESLKDMIENYANQWVAIARKSARKDLEKRHAKLSSDLVRVITSYESARKINGKLEVEKLELLAKVHRLENEVDAYHKALTNKKEPVGADDRNTLHYFDLYQDEKEEGIVCQKLLTKVEMERDSERSKRVELENEYDVLKSKFRKEKLISETERDTLKVNAMTLEDKHANLKKEVDDLRRNYNGTEENARLLEKKNAALQLKLSDANRKMEVYKKDAKEAEKKASDLERVMFEKGLSARDEIDDLRQKYETQCVKKKELERTTMELRNTIDKLQLVQKKTHADYLKDIERDHGKYHSKFFSLVFS